MPKFFTTKSKVTAEITVRYPLAFMDRRWERVVAPTLSHTLRLPPLTMRFYASDHRHLRYYAGLLHRVLQHFARLSIPVEVIREPSYEPEGLPDLFAGSPEAPSGEFAQVLRDNPCGQLLVDTRRDAPTLLARTLDAIPNANIVVVAPSKREALKLARRTARISLRPLQTEVDFSVWRRVLVTHPAIYRECQDEVGDWNVTVFSEPRAALYGFSRDRLAHAPRMRRYCLVPRHETLRPYERLRLEEQCGIPIYHLVDPRKDTADVVVLTTHFPAPAKLRPATTTLATKLEWYWSNNRRNRYIADLARAAWTGDMAMLRQLLGAQNFDIASELLRSGQGSTTVLVESSLHASGLARLLPTWLPTTLDLPTERYEVDGEITSFLAAQRFGLHAKIVIRADGGPAWPSQIRYPPLRASVGADQILLIDVCDQAHRQQIQCADSRRQAYEQLGWIIL